MRSRTIGLVLFGGFLLVLLLSVMAFTAQQAKADPPLSGNWVISNTQAFTDKNFIVNGSLIVQNNGRLTLQNTIIRMNPNPNGYVQVEKGGTLLVRGGSIITTYAGFPYGIVAFNNSRLEITNSSVYDAGWTFTGNGSSAGIFIDSTNVLIADSLFARDYYGVIVNGRDIAIEHCQFLNITNTGIHVFKATVTVANSELKWNSIGVRVIAGNVQGTNLTIIGNAYGLSAVNSKVNIETSTVKYNYFDLYAQNSTVSVFNSTMWSDDYELHLVNGTKLNLVNTTFNDQAMAFDDNADQVDVYWYMRAHVTWQNGDPIASANLTVTDILGTVVFDGNVMTDGWSDVLVLNEYLLVSGPTNTQTLYTPHNLTAGLNGMNDTVFAGIAKSMDLEIKVYDLTMPFVNVTFPTGPVAVNYMPYKINGTASDVGSGLKLVEVSAGSGQWLPANGTSSWDYDVNMTYDGVFLIEVRAVDMVGNSYTVAFYLTLDTMPPFFDIYGPYNNTLTSAANVNVTGMIEPGGRVTVNGQNASVDSNTGVWYRVVPLKAGANTITVVAWDRVGNNATAVLTVRRDSVPPSLQVGTPSEGLVTNAQNITVSGATELTAQITINGLGVYNNNGQFNTLFTLNPGLNRLVIRAADAAGNFAEIVINVTFDDTVPYIAVATPVDGYVSANSTILVRGLTEPGATVIVGGFPAVNLNGMFQTNYTLKEGKNFILIKITDAAGNENQLTINVTYDNVPPVLTIDSPANGLETSSGNITVKGAISDATHLWVNGKEVDISTLNGKPYQYTVQLSLGANPITVRAEDGVGNYAQRTITITRVSPKNPTTTKSMAQRLFDFNDPLGLIFLLAIIIVIVGCIIAGVMAVKAPATQPSRPRGPPVDDREGPPPYRGRGPPPGRRPPPPPPRRPGYEGVPQRRPGYPGRPGGPGPAYVGPAYSPEPEPPAPPAPPPVPVYAPQPEPEVEEPIQPPKVVEYEEPTPPPIEAAPEPGIPDIPPEEPLQEHDQLEASIQSILTTLGTKPEEPQAPEVVPMSLPVEIKDESPRSKDVLSEITCPNCHADVKSSWATCPFCDYNLKGGGKPATKAEQPQNKPKKEEPEEVVPPKKEPPKEKAPLPTKVSGGEVRPIDLEEPTGRPLKAPAPEPKVEPKPPEAPQQPQKPGKDGKNLDDILKKLKIQ